MIDTMLITSTLEHQPSFPKEDLTAKNAEALSIMLQNRAMLMEGHRAAELATPIYKLGHQAFRTAIDRFHTNQSVIEAFNSGIALYEAVSSYVTHPPTVNEEAPLILNAFGLAGQVSSRHFDEYSEEAVTAFIYATPRAAEVVAESAQMYVGVHLARLAVIGAGMARKFELDNAEIDEIDSGVSYFT